MAIPKVNTKSLIKSKLPASTTNTLSVPKPTVELSNVETLNSKNLVGEGNTPLPETIKDQKIAEGVEKNTPGMAACIKEKIKDLAGVFTVPLGIPSFDQFKVPDINDAPNLSVKDAFKATFDDIKNTVKGTVNGIKDAFTFKKQQGLDQIETGGLSLKKFLGCEEMDVDFTPRERKEAAEKPEIITKKEEEGVKKSQVALAAQADENVKQRTEPPAEKSKQEEVEALTDVEIVPPLNWKFLKYIIFSTPDSLPLPDNAGTIDNIDATISATDGEKFIADAIRRIVEVSKKDIKNIIDNKEGNPILKDQFYDIKLYKQQEKDFRKLIPAGYLSLLFDIEQKHYALNPANDLGESDISLIIQAYFKVPGEKFPTLVYIQSDISKTWFGIGYKGGDLTFYDYLTNRISPLYKFIKTDLKFKNV